MDLFGAAHEWGGRGRKLPRICHIYPTIIKLGTAIPYLKYLNHLTHPSSCVDISIFQRKSANLLY